MSEDRKGGPVIFGLPGASDETAAAALSRMGNFTQSDKDIALEMAVAGLVSDAWRKPPPTASTNSPVLPKGTGWRDPGPLLPPPGIAVIDAMAHTFQPHGVGNPERRETAPAAPASPPVPTSTAATSAATPAAAAAVTRRRLT
jgi:hypothetical protein